MASKATVKSVEPNIADLVKNHIKWITNWSRSP